MDISNQFFARIRRFGWLGPRSRRYSAAGLVVLLLMAVGLFFNAPPQKFPAGTVVTVSAGSSVSSQAEKLKVQSFISSSFLFTRLVPLVGKKGIIAGDYYFPSKLSLFEVVMRITHGTFGMQPAKITIPEGYTVSDIGSLFQSGRFYKFSAVDFIALAKSKEGYLFPDTYFFMPSVTASDITQTLSDNFNAKIKPYAIEIASSTHSLSDIISVASIVEKEAASSTDRQVISGIIWQRLKLGMPLQVDATLGYVLDKGTFQLTSNDLKLDSPYNTYVYRGLPPAPIGNPGLDSIDATLHPATTKYLYYLSDKSGKVYYAKNFAEHQVNRQKYLGK